MIEILKMLNTLSADDLEGVIMRAKIILEKKRKEEAERARLEQERLRQEKIEQEKKRLAEIEELQRRLQELQRQAPATPVVPQPAPRPAPAAPQPAPVRPVPQPAPAAPSPAPAPVQPAPASRPAPAAPQPAPAPKKPVPQVRHMDESVKDWDKIPDEKTIIGEHDIQFIQPQMSKKQVYQMQVTNKRILITRAGMVSQALMSSVGAGIGGFVGSLVSAGLEKATGSGPKPWLEIPLAAVRHCGVQNKKEFFIEADQVYVLRNHHYEQKIPMLVQQAKQEG